VAFVLESDKPFPRKCVSGCRESRSGLWRDAVILRWWGGLCGCVYVWWWRTEAVVVVVALLLPLAPLSLNFALSRSLYILPNSLFSPGMLGISPPPLSPASLSPPSPPPTPLVDVPKCHRTPRRTCRSRRVWVRLPAKRTLFVLGTIRTCWRLRESRQTRLRFRRLR